MLLCIDIGNTDTDLYLVENDEIKDKLIFSTKENLSFDLIKTKLDEFLKNQSLFDCIISSVVPSINDAYQKYFQERFNLDVIFVKYNSLSPVTIVMRTPDECGADLYADTVGAKVKYGSPCLVVDIGTATKFLMVNEHDEFYGASIAPGILGSLNSLFSTTELLKEFNLTSVSNILGNDTISCIESGTIYGHVSMIDGMIDRIKEEVKNPNLKVIITGGFSKLYPYLKNQIIYDPYLIVYGLIELYKQNKRKK